MSFAVVRKCLQEWGYTVVHRVIDYRLGGMEERRRLLMVATTKGLDVDLESLAAPGAPPRLTINDILDDVPDDSPRWSAMEGLRAKERRDLAAGKNFRMTILRGNETIIPGITRQYWKWRSTDPKVAHPTKPGLLRQFSAREHARIKGVPERLIQGLCETTGHEILGQGVQFPAFRLVGRFLAQVLRKAPAAVGEPVQGTLLQVA